MADLRVIADKLGKPRAEFAMPGIRKNAGIDLSHEALTRYPTVTMLCFTAICAGVLAVAAASVIGFLIFALG
jgi:hypothetical protein